MSTINERIAKAVTALRAAGHRVDEEPGATSVYRGWRRRCDRPCRARLGHPTWIDGHAKPLRLTNQDAC